LRAIMIPAARARAIQRLLLLSARGRGGGRGGAAPDPYPPRHHPYSSAPDDPHRGDQERRSTGGGGGGGISSPGVGFAFDIDGVLARGGEPLPASAAVRELLTTKTTAQWLAPTVFVTNGGGMTEARKAAQLSEMLGVSVSERQVLLSHTPFRARLAQRFANAPVLVAGRGDVGAVARSYGFRAVVTTRELALADPRALPFRRPADFGEEAAGGAASGVGEGFGAGGDRESGGGGGGAGAGAGGPPPPPPPPHLWGTPLAPFQAVLVFSDPHDWYADLQLMIDVSATRGAPLPLPVRAESGAAHAEQQHQPPDFFFSNPDLLWAASHPRPRFGQGAFACAFAAVHRRVLGHAPRARFFGKPTAATARMAEDLLVRQAAELGAPGAATAAEALADLERRHSEVFWGERMRADGEVAEDEAEEEVAAAAARARRDVLSSIFPAGVCMVGDNPRADVRLARRAGAPWISALVRTGVFDGGGSGGGRGANDPVDPADMVVRDCRAAIEAALHRGRAERWHRLR
jgi:HAD superfamily hydrolase (TIGR01450 family)